MIVNGKGVGWVQEIQLPRKILEAASSGKVHSRGFTGEDRGDLWRRLP